jgi:hypothetical protein
MIDYTHTLKDAGLVASSAAGQVDSSDKIVDLGAGLVEGHLVVDVTAIEIADNDEYYDIQLQGRRSRSNRRRSRQHDRKV